MAPAVLRAVGMNLVPPFVNGSKKVNVIIETPAGSRSKYEWDPELQLMRLKQVLPLGLEFPFDFGFVPGTRADDGDPVDVLLISDAPLAVGALAQARVIGALEIKQTAKGSEKITRNDRLIGVPLESIRCAKWRDLEDAGEPLLSELEGFLESYVKREGRKFRLLGRAGRKRALELLEHAVV